MARYEINGAGTAPIHAKASTMLLLINNQLGLRDEKAWGTAVSNPAFEENTKALLAAFREPIGNDGEEKRPSIMHAQYRPVWSDHPLHASRTGPFGPNGEEKRAIDFLEFSAPRKFDRDGKEYFVYSFDEFPPPREMNQGDNSAQAPSSHESIMTTHGHSVFINTPLGELLAERKIRTLLIAGLSLDGNVSTAVRMAQNLALVGKWGGGGNMVDTKASSLWTDGEAVLGALADSDDPAAEGAAGGLAVDMPRIIVVEDATRVFGRGGIDAQTMHEVHVESLRDFAEVRSTAEVVKAFSYL